MSPWWKFHSSSYQQARQQYEAAIARVAGMPHLHMATTNSTNLACTCTTVDVTTIGDATRKTMTTVDPSCPFHGQMSLMKPGDVMVLEGLYDINGEKVDSIVLDDLKDGNVPEVEPEEPRVPDGWDCCDDPKPLVHHQSGRFFCGNCRRWLDQPREEEKADE